MRAALVVAALALTATVNPVTATSPFVFSAACSERSVSQFPGPETSPIIRVLTESELRGWRPAECTGFDPLDVNSLVITLGSIRVPGGVETLADRLARVSALTSIKYYPDDDDGWRPLFTASHALRDDGFGVSSEQIRRPDFRPDDIQTGRTLRYRLEENSLLRPATYRLTIRERSPDRLVYSILNESDIGALFVRAIEPGEMRQLYVIERDPTHPDGEVWRFSGLVEARTQAGPFRLPTRSYISRAAAYFRYMAGIPTDLEPPIGQ